MTTFEKRSDGTYDDRDSHDERHSHGRDNHPGRDHQQRAGLPAGGNVMSTWTLAFYDYAEQILKAQRQFAHSMLGAAAPMLDVARDVMSADVNEDRSANNQLDARGDQRHGDSNRLRRNERYNDDDAAEYNNRSADDNASDANGSDISRTERANTQAEQSGKTRSPVAASATARKRP
jgi:hypothetical protein